MGTVATVTVTSKEEITALRAARKAQPDMSKGDLAAALVAERKYFGKRGRPAADRAGLNGPARTLAERTEGWIARNLPG